MALEYIEEYDVPRTWFTIDRLPPLKADSTGPVLAKLLLKIPRGDYVTREISSRLQSYIYRNPEVQDEYDFDTVYYSLGEDVETSDYEPNIYLVPVRIHLRPLRNG